MKRYTLKSKQVFTDWDRIIHLLEHVPITFYPGLVIKLAEISLQKGVWQMGGLSRTIINLEHEYYRNKGEVNDQSSNRIGNDNNSS